MKTQTVYKVVSRHNKKLFSYAGVESERECHHFTIRYFVNKTVRPRPTQNQVLFCFDTLENAKLCLEMTPSCVEDRFAIYEARATNVTRTAILNKKKVTTTSYRKGTLFASSLKLTQRIKVSKYENPDCL